MFFSASFIIIITSDQLLIQSVILPPLLSSLLYLIRNKASPTLKRQRLPVSKTKLQQFRQVLNPSTSTTPSPASARQDTSKRRPVSDIAAELTFILRPLAYCILFFRSLHSILLYDIDNHI